jgi:hypothetical protein
MGYKLEPKGDLITTWVSAGVDEGNVSLASQNRWMAFWMKIWAKPRGCVWTILNCENWCRLGAEVLQTWFDEDVDFFLVGEVCHRVKIHQGVGWRKALLDSSYGVAARVTVAKMVECVCGSTQQLAQQYVDKSWDLGEDCLRLDETVLGWHNGQWEIRQHWWDRQR